MGKMKIRRSGLGPWSVHRALATAAENRRDFADRKRGGRIAQKNRALFWIRHAADLRAALEAKP